MGLNTKRLKHGNLHPDFLYPDKEKGEQEPKYDLILQVTFNLDNPEKTVIKTNAKKEAVEGILEAWLSGQVGKGEDESKANEKSEYNIEIQLDLSYDTFYTKSDAGNKGLTCGIIMNVFSRLDKITILDLEGNAIKEEKAD